MFAIESITLFYLDLPLKESFETANHRLTTRKTIVLKLTDSTGQSAFSECPAFEQKGYFKQSLDEVWETLRVHGPACLKQPLSAETLSQFFPNQNKLAFASLEMALTLLEALSQKKSLSDYLGGTQTKIPITTTIGFQSSPEALIKAIEKRKSEGYIHFKVKIKPQQDINFVRTVRNTYPELSLAVDANQSYTSSQQNDLIDLETFHLRHIEQPFPASEGTALLKLAKIFKTPIALDESLAVLDLETEKMLTQHPFVLSLKPAILGGFGEAKKLYNRGLQEHHRMFVGGLLESGIGRAYALAFASLPGFTEASELSPANSYLAETLTRTSADTVGLGIRVCEDAIDNTCIRHKLLK